MRTATKIIFWTLYIGGITIGVSKAQVPDTAALKQIIAKKDSIVKNTTREKALKTIANPEPIGPKARNPRKAALYSAILPGWGQVYNRKIWKVPIVYAALGATGGYFLYNLTWYKKYRSGVQVISTLSQSSNTDFKQDPEYLKLDRIVRLTYEKNGIENVRFFRNDFRKNVDYSAIYFVLAWGLNVIDAAVDAHLSSFDVSPDLTFKILPGFSEMANTTGISLVLKIKP